MSSSLLAPDVLLWCLAAGILCSSGGVSSPAGRVLQPHVCSWVERVVNLFFTKPVTSSYFGLRVIFLLSLCYLHGERGEVGEFLTVSVTSAAVLC